ncbi:GATOR complex protein Iml1-like isoform X2 [Mya arenaria]|uniref:GATOR complex protein Iml1-like isoform X2 n=1 Tax=Mya arenaria TaxID=6604 RepID=UPI0022E37099|nr:GATOR complex protein Iml1-like isoform X2 [Mya arenaria]
MKTLKLWVHKKKAIDKQGEEISLNPREVPDIVIGDVVEIYHPEEEYSRLLLQVNNLQEDFGQKDSVVSIEQSIAAAFQLKAYKNVIINKVDKEEVTADLVEVLFKDQYYSRSDMNRFRNNMIGTCVYLNKKIDFCEMRAQVNELWCRGERVTCGVISEDTRIVFRSSTAVVQVFIQMSSEMWEFDINGDLYFEKAVNGFLCDLYAKWKEQNCLHDVSIVMFSRTFYDAQSRDEFPPYMQDCLQQDHMGRFYEDFYRIVVQNERYDEWTGTIKQLRKNFYEYPKRVLNYHDRPGFKVPKAKNSTAAQGNFLETLNMTLNLFERYYYDRNFDRTGKVAVVITPGAGVFEVDRELTNITKQRTIDCGIGSDLVCMGEQPLHAAPLFKFHSKSQGMMAEVGDDYNIPHWMNHSFYTSKNQIQFYSNKTFVPRIKIPPEIFEMKKVKELPREQDNLSCGSDDDNFPFVDYDEYDAQVFKLPAKNVPMMTYGRSNKFGKKQRSERNMDQVPHTVLEAKMLRAKRHRTISDNISSLPVEKTETTLVSKAMSIPSQSSSGYDDISTSIGCYPAIGIQGNTYGSTEGDSYMTLRPIVGSAGSPVSHRKSLHKYKRHRALINPFAPSRMQFKMTSNRRRWVHAFPTDPHGAAVQTHHVHTYSYHDNADEDPDLCELTAETIQAAQLAVKERKELGINQSSDSISDFDDISMYKSGSPSKGWSSYDILRGSTGAGAKDLRSQHSFLWGPTGEQEWSPELTTGQDWRPLDDAESSKTESRLIKPILTADFENTQNFCAGISVDWKSLIMPASLPITTDYFPDAKSLNNDYMLSEYQLIPETLNSGYFTNPPDSEDERYYRKTPLTTKQVFNEMISQRLAQGFQLINMLKYHGPSQQVAGQGSLPHRYILGSSPQVSSSMTGLRRARPREEHREEIYLSIGRIFHKLSLEGLTITVTRYRPRHPNAQLSYNYKYRFQAPDSYNYDVSWSEFRNEKLENYNWNYLDQYICTRGEGDFGLMDSLKFWRSRFFILPCSNSATKKIIDGHPRCDIYEEKTGAELKQLLTGFTKYLETLNKMKRTATTRITNCKHKQFLDKNPGGIPMPDTRPDDEVLSVTSPSDKIVKWMLDDECGIPMLPKQQGLPNQSFISAEVVEWCYYHVKGVKGVKHAMEVLQQVLHDGYIIHASGSPTHQMIYGFYLYTFREGKNDLSCNPLFQNDWCEVAFMPVVDNVGPSYVKFSLEEEGHNADDLTIPPDDWRVQTGLNVNGNTWAQQSGILWLEESPPVGILSGHLNSATLMHKYVNVEVDTQNRSDRPEWATARYHAYYSPLNGFELQVQWMVSTGQILGELVNNWGRKAGSCQFHILPVPCDPFALPSAMFNDPLRGPIFVPLSVTAMEPEGVLFANYDEDTREQRILQLQEAIIKRFGFMGSSVRIGENKGLPHRHEEYHQYVHCTGGMFIIIEETKASASTPTVKEKKVMTSPASYGHSVNFSAARMTRSCESFKKSSAEMRKDYIARQTSQTIDAQKYEQEVEIGFLWSWNFMLSKKWRSSNTGDEIFQDTVLRDFRAFCSNQENRLFEFWCRYKGDDFL